MRIEARSILAEFGECGLIVACARHQRRLHAQRRLRPRGELVVEITGRVGESRENNHLAVSRIDRIANLGPDHRSQFSELGIARRIDLARRGQKGSEPIAVLDQVLPPPDQIDILQSTLTLRPTRRLSNAGSPISMSSISISSSSSAWASIRASVASTSRS